MGKSASKVAAPVVNVMPVKAVPVPLPKTNGYYTNTAGTKVLRPYVAPSIPVGASARCGDGTFSFSRTRRGTCSHHGGVKTWY